MYKRQAPGWAYGLPELGKEALDAILFSKRVAVPGCHASGFIALVAPLIKEGLLSPETPLSCTSLTGYSGGGKKMIADYREKGAAYDPPRPCLLYTSCPRTRPGNCGGFRIIRLYLLRTQNIT